MTFRVRSLCLMFLGLVFLFAGASSQMKELRGGDLLVEYDRLKPINHAIQQNQWTDSEQYPKKLGDFNSKEVQEQYWCGDVCPQYGSVNLVYSGVKEVDCPVVGQALYSYFWGRQYQGCGPLINQDGVLIANGFSWLFSYRADEAQTRTLVQELLLLDESSTCEKDAEKISCATLREGQRVSIVASKSESALTVVRLDLGTETHEP